MNNKLKIWAISDTHGFHSQLKVPEGIDMVIFSGDCAHSREKEYNVWECRSFLEWYYKLDIKYKLLVGGNHDISFERNLITGGDLAAMGIIYLENSSTTIEGLKIFGSPITPTFGNGWAFNRDRGKTSKYWNLIDNDTDIVIVHGPPLGILDYSEDRDGNITQCGCKSLLRAMERVRPKLMCFGHIHDYKYFKNAGYYVDPVTKTIFSNGACVTDGKFDLGITSHGNVFEL